MWISIEEIKEIMDKQKTTKLPEIILTDFLNNPKYKIRFNKETDKVEWVKNSSL